jgi:hypothetical protein
MGEHKAAHPSVRAAERQAGKTPADADQYSTQKPRNDIAAASDAPSTLGGRVIRIVAQPGLQRWS